MTNREPWMPSDEVLIGAAVYAEDEYGSRGDCGEEMDRYYLEKAAEPIRSLIRASVEQASAEERARHAREQTEFIGAALHEFGVSGDDAQPGELPGNYLLRLIREINAALAALEEGK